MKFPLAKRKERKKKCKGVFYFQGHSTTNVQVKGYLYCVFVSPVRYIIKRKYTKELSSIKFLKKGWILIFSLYSNSSTQFLLVVDLLKIVFLNLIVFF